MKIVVDKRTILMLFIFFAVIVTGLFYASLYNKKNEEQVMKAIKKLEFTDAEGVSRAVLQLWDMKLAAADSIEYLLPLLGDTREVPDKVLENTKYYDALKKTRRGRPELGISEENLTIGNCAASALVSIGGLSSNRSFFDNSFKHIKARKRIIIGVIPLLKNGSTAEKLNALHVVTFIRRREALQPLTELLDDSADEVRVMAAAALIAYEPLYDLSVYVPRLIELLKEDDEILRFTVTKALNLITGQHLNDDYFVWQKWMRSNYKK